LRNLPMDKLHAAAKRALEEELDVCDTFSSSDDVIQTVDSTPALTPQEFKNGYQNSYSDYYDTWSSSTNPNGIKSPTNFDILPSKTFKALQEQAMSGCKKPWAARCPRVLSSKSLHRDLGRVAEIRESESPEVQCPGSRSSSVASNASTTSGTTPTFNNNSYRSYSRSNSDVSSNENDLTMTSSTKIGIATPDRRHMAKAS